MLFLFTWTVSEYEEFFEEIEVEESDFEDESEDDE